MQGKGKDPLIFYSQPSIGEVRHSGNEVRSIVPEIRRILPQPKMKETGESSSCGLAKGLEC